MTTPRVTNVIDRLRGPVVSVLALARVRPNHVTVVGALIAAAAGYLAGAGLLSLAGLVFLVGSGLDGFDGALARRTGRVSKFGAFLDSLLDRVGEGALLTGLAAYFARVDDDWGVVLAVAALLSSVMVSYARARAEGLGFRGAGGLSPRPVRVVLLALGLLTGDDRVVLAVLVLVAVLSSASVVQRAAAVWRQANAAGPGPS